MQFPLLASIQLALIVFAGVLHRELSASPIFSSVPLIAALLNLICCDYWLRSDSDCEANVPVPPRPLQLLMFASTVTAWASGLITLPFALFFLAVTAMILQISTQRADTSTTPAAAVPRLSLAVFSLLLGWTTVLLNIFWPRIASCAVRLPLVWAELLAGTANLLKFGISAPYATDQNSLAFYARSGIPTLSTADGQHLLLLNYENLQIHALTLSCLAGIACLTFISPHRRFARYILFLAGALVLFYIHGLMLWTIVVRDIASGLDIWQWKIQCSALIAVLIAGLTWFVHKSFRDEAPAGSPLRFNWCISSRSRVSFASILIFALLGCGALVYDPGVRKQGRVVIDEHHSQWERTDLPTNAEFFGTKTTYNYGFLREILGKHYPSVRLNREPLTPELLADCDVLILKTPTQPFSLQEVRAVHEFVETGGGVWLIGDHTNIFGMNTYLNQMAGDWGFTFSADSLNAVAGYFEDRVRVRNVPQLHEKCGKRGYDLLYSRPCLNHPVMGNKIPYCTILTSCSIKGHLFSSVINIAEAVYSDDAHFGSNTFFGDHQRAADENYGSFLQAVAAQSGYGRVATWSDSTLFSNFSMCMNGVPQLAIGSVEWLNHRNTVHSNWITVFQMSLAAAVLCGLVAAAITPGRMILFLLSGLMAVICCVPVAELINRTSYPAIPVKTGFRTVGFDQEYSVLELPQKNHVHDGDPEVFESLFVDVQRLHCMPFAADTFAELLQSDALIICNPRNPVSAGDIAGLRKYISDGGRVLLMMNNKGQSVDPSLTLNRLNRLLTDLNAQSHFKDLGQNDEQDLFGVLADDVIVENVSISTGVSAPSRAEVLLESADGTIVCCRERCGQGEVFLCSAAHLLSNTSLGEPTGQLDRVSAVSHFVALRLLSLLTGDEDMQLGQAEMEKPWRDLLETRGDDDAE